MDDENAPYDPTAIRNLVIAIMEQGVEDILLGNPNAIHWMNSRDFEHYCAWLDINPTAAREAIQAQRLLANQAKYSEDELRRVKHLHDNGVAWHIAMQQVFGYFSETLRQVVRDYNALTKRPSASA